MASSSRASENFRGVHLPTKDEGRGTRDEEVSAEASELRLTEVGFDINSQYLDAYYYLYAAKYDCDKECAVSQARTISMNPRLDVLTSVSLYELSQEPSCTRS